MSKSRETLNSLLSKVDIEGKIVLDIGVQDKPTSRLTKGTPKKYLTMDIDPQWQPDFVADLNLDITFGEKGDHTYWMSNDNYIHSGSKPAKVDIVFCIEVLEHCWNSIQAIKNMSSFLERGGHLHISTPFINPHHDVVDYLRYTDEWYQKILPVYGLEIIELHERRATTGLADLQSFYRNEGLRYSKIRQKIKPYTYPIGYYVIAKKI